MTDPITPPPELVQQWNMEGRHQDYCTLTESIAARAAQWGADQELEACCALMDDWGLEASDLRAARRSKPPNLKEQALDDFNGLMQELDGAGAYSNCANRIRRALEALDD
jgi:hypothetical protein